MARHVTALHEFYGEDRGHRIARKHIGWYLQGLGLGEIARRINRLPGAAEQRRFIHSLTLKKVA